MSQATFAVFCGEIVQVPGVKTNEDMSINEASFIDAP